MFFYCFLLVCFLFAFTLVLTLSLTIRVAEALYKNECKKLLLLRNPSLLCDDIIFVDICYLHCKLTLVMLVMLILEVGNRFTSIAEWNVDLFALKPSLHYAHADRCSASPAFPGQNGGTIPTNRRAPDWLPQPRSSPGRCLNVRPAPPCGRAEEGGKM